ncbi:hypothetical protein PI124_g1515 [Phytophthora idaei]|nr:hypothetical protein PI125_g1225 [Phytophthora idaei]KAG3169220.1 hypothetical protein PI126_g2916 [Phytophthora idaei]KAG3253905.1 hypothetical protein PI124_g1515 [Phytophthora idaei]
MMLEWILAAVIQNEEMTGAVIANGDLMVDISRFVGGGIKELMMKQEMIKVHHFDDLLAFDGRVFDCLTMKWVSQWG